jgi:hypothetical protein
MKAKDLIPGCIGTLRVGARVLVKGLDMKGREVLSSGVIVRNGIDTAIRFADGVTVKQDGADVDFFMDMPSVRVRLQKMGFIFA